MAHGQFRLGPPACIIVIGTIGCVLRALIYLSVIVVASLILSGETDSDTKEVIALVEKQQAVLWFSIGLSAAGLLFEVGVAVGYSRASRCMTITSLVIFIMALIACLACTAAFVHIVRKATEANKEKKPDELTKAIFKIHAEKESGRDHVQAALECCGVFGYADYTQRHPNGEIEKEIREMLGWYTGSIPLSCKGDDGIHKTGCQKKILDSLQHLTPVIALYGTMCGLFLAGIVLNSIALCTWNG